MRISKKVVILTAAVAGAIAVGTFALGRVTVDTTSATTSARSAGYRSGHDAGYFDGLQAGDAQGREEGRALQAASVVSADSRQPVQDAFTQGYAAGTSDAFGNFDGGWQIGVPYIATVDHGSGSVVYRFQTRTLMQPGVDYYLCPDGHSICQSARH